jgi:hypothetical protein
MKKLGNLHKKLSIFSTKKIKVFFKGVISKEKPLANIKQQQHQSLIYIAIGN